MVSPMFRRAVIVLAAALLLLAKIPPAAAQSTPQHFEPAFQYDDTRQLVALVTDASTLIRTRGEAAFADLRVDGSRWRHGEQYVFVLDPAGMMLVHPDSTLEGTDQIGLKDINGKPIIRGLIDVATTSAVKSDGWYHYEWTVPGALLPRWKSSYVRLVRAPSGKSYIVGSGVYNDRMERAFVTDAVQHAAATVEQDGTAAFALFRDPTGPFIAKDAYIFVLDPQGVELVNPAFRNLEGQSVLEIRDTNGKRFAKEMLDVVNTNGAGWVDYMWPKPGESVSTQKSTFVTKAKLGDRWVLVGCGVYLAEAPKAPPTPGKMRAAELIALVRDGAALLAKQGEAAYAAFSQRGSKWFRGDTYFFVWTLDGTRVFHAADPEGEGETVVDMKDVLGRSVGATMLEIAKGQTGEGWVHYMRPEPGSIFPTWKSTFVKRVTFPSGAQYLVGSGIYNMQMDKPFITDVVDRAAALIAAHGTDAFPILRDKTGPFVFMDTYVFVNSADGVELVNPAQPSLEGVNLTGLKDVNGKPIVDEYIALALANGTGWVSYSWYRPGSNTPAPKQTYVRKVVVNNETYVVGSGLYVEPTP